jgi:hypothetical protein
VEDIKKIKKMGRIEKQKRLIIEQANRRLLNEQNEELSKEYIDRKTKEIQGLIPYEVKSGDNIDSIIKKSKEKEDGLHFLPFDEELNTHIVDRNKIYPGDVLFFMSDPTNSMDKMES